MCVCSDRKQFLSVCIEPHAYGGGVFFCLFVFCVLFFFLMIDKEKRSKENTNNK